MSRTGWLLAPALWVIVCVSLAGMAVADSGADASHHRGSFTSGGPFALERTGWNGIAKDALFVGTFAGPMTWRIQDLSDGTHTYTLMGSIRGTGDGKNVTAAPMQLRIDSGKEYFGGAATAGEGDTVLSTSVPEPSSLALFGAGTLLLSGVLRRKAKAQARN